MSEIKSSALQEIVDEVARAPQAEVLAGAPAVLAVIAEAMLDRLGLPYEGRARVSINVDEQTVITLDWENNAADTNAAADTDEL